MGVRFWKTRLYSFVQQRRRMKLILHGRLLCAARCLTTDGKVSDGTNPIDSQRDTLSGTRQNSIMSAKSGERDLKEEHGSQSLFQHSENAYDLKTLEYQVRKWGEMRRVRLTASVFAFAIGFWEGRRVQLWEEKVGLREPFQGNLATNWGTVKEATAINRYIKLTNNKVIHLMFKSYPSGSALPDWMGCSPDGLIEGQTHPVFLENGGILEVKCPFNKGNPDEGVPWPYVPHYYIPQAQGLMEIFDRDWLDFYIWTMNGSSVYRVNRDPDLWELMLTALNDFWWGHVVPARQLLLEDSKANVKRYKPSPHHLLYLTISNKCKLLASKCPLLINDVQTSERPKLTR